MNASKDYTEKEIKELKPYVEEHPMLDYKVTKYKHVKLENFLASLKRKKANYYMRRTGESCEIIWNQTKFVFAKGSKFPVRKLYLFKMVKNDAEKWVKNRRNFVEPPKHKPSFYNLDYDDSYGNLVGVDLNHAFWRIAYTNGMISENTYQHGLDPSCKALRLASLSVLGREKKIQKYKGGRKVDIPIVVNSGNDEMKKIFSYIRHYCYRMMFDLSRQLGDDFEAWKTDAIYFRSSEKNIKIVEGYFKKRNMTYKTLGY